MQRHAADAVAGFLRTHAVLSAGVAVTALFVTKVWLSAGAEPSVAAGIVAASGSLELATSLLVLALPVLALVLAAVLLLMALPGGSGRLGLAAAIGAAAALLLSVAIVPLGLLFSVLVAAGLAAMVIRLRRPRSRPVTGDTPLGGLATVAGLLGALWIVQPSLMWLPAERLTIEGADGVEVGYVIEDEGPWLTVLRHDDRRLLRVEAGSVTDREICSFVGAGSVIGRSLASLLVAPGSSRLCTADP
jgi:hypothetical protein